MSARDLIRATADDHGWTAEIRTQWCDRLTRPVTLTDPKQARIFEVTGHAPAELVVIYYDELGRVRHLNTAGPGAQSALTGVHVGLTDYVNLGRKNAALRFLTQGVA